MSNLNKVMLIGNLTRDPEVKHTPKGTAIAEIGIAINRRAPDGNGGYKDETTFVDVTAWGSTAENAGKYLTKGRSIFVEGRLHLESWDDKATGQKRSKLKVVAESIQFLGGKSEGGQVQQQRSEVPKRTAAGGIAVDKDDTDDDIPF